MNKYSLLYLAAILTISISSGPLAFGSSDEETVQKLVALDRSVYRLAYTAMKAATEPIVLSCNKAGRQEVEVELELKAGITPQKIRAVISGSADSPKSVVMNRVDEKSDRPKIKDIRIDYARPAGTASTNESASASELSEESLRAAMTKISWFELNSARSSKYYAEYHQVAQQLFKPDPATPKTPLLQGVLQIGGPESYIDGLADGISASLPSFWKSVHERCANGTQVLGNPPPTGAGSSGATSSGASLTSQ